MRSITVTRALFISLLALVASAGCAQTATTVEPNNLFAEGPGRVVLSLEQLSCASCSNNVMKAVEAIDGVSKTAFDMSTVEIGVAFDPTRTTPDTILAASRTAGEQVSLGAGQGSYASPVDHLEGSDTQIISRGEEVDITPHLVAGKITVVDFYADWCGPCRRVAIIMNTIMSDRDDVALRKIDIVDWDTPVAKQHMSGVASLPFTIIYDANGREFRRITGLDIPGLHKAIEEAGGATAEPSGEPQ